MRDILKREKRRGQRQITDSDLLRKIIMFLADNIGNSTSITPIGKVGDREVDFIATNANEKRYIQVTESMTDPAVREREIAPLRKTRDNYEKLIITGNGSHPVVQDGIKVILLTDFLLG